MPNPRMTAEIGRVLGGRYRLVAPIGMGASAQVYLADDVRLRRRVALKMLHDALAGDAEFLRRFRAEARAAAALSHPNVMAVYDWGDDEVAFIVTEYLGGGSLRGLLDRGELLTPSQALTVGLEATRALDYAHRRGFVHRDVKPANLLFGEEQRLRIADFGLARALAEAAWTEPQGAMLGTARYASPEQAKGEKLNGKADVYALALVLVEAVTGQVPFAADTTLGTLMARVDKPLVVPDELGPLQAVLTRAGHPDPEQRIDARALAAGLLRAAKALPKPAPLPLAGALSRDGELAIDADPTVHGPMAGAVSPPEIAPDLTADDLDLDPPDWVNQAEPLLGVGARVGAAAASAGGALLAPRSRRGALAPLPGGDDDLAPDGGVGPVEAEGSGDGSSGHGGAAVDVDADADEATAARGGDDTAAVDVLHLDEPDHADGADDAEHGDAGPVVERVVIIDAGGEVGPDDDAATVAPADDPAEAVIDLRTGDDPTPAGHRAVPAWADAPARVPEPVDRIVDPRATVAALAAAATGGGAAAGASGSGSTATLVAPDPDPDDGGVGDASDDRGSGRRRRRWPWLVLLVVLLAGGGGVAAAAVVAGEEPAPPPRVVVLPVPSLVDRAQTSAEAVAEAAGWKTTVVTERRDGTIAGQVLATDPAAGVRLRPGQTVELTVSAGQTEVDVPGELAGQPLAEATAALEAVGLQATTAERRFDEEIPEGSVIGVAGGTPPRLEKGTSVSLVVSDGPEPRTVPSGLVGNTVEGATEALAALQLAAAENRQFNDDVPEGRVVSQSPPPGERVPRGSTVTLEVSRGPRLVAVPDVSGASTPAEAAALIRSAGLVPGSVSGSPEGSPGTSPGAGTMVRPGATVDIVLG